MDNRTEADRKRIIPFADQYIRFLSDESRMTGYADSISFPESGEDVKQILKELPAGTKITCQGSCTGIRGESVPYGGHIMNFSRMNRIRDMGILSDTEAFVIAEPGVTLEQLDRETAREFRDEQFFWPPSPTEKTASVAGVACTGASGMNAAHYGPSWQYIRSLTFLDREGKETVIEDGGRIREFLQNVSGPIVSLTLRLLKRPASIWGIVFFFEKSEDALACADALRGFDNPSPDAWIASLEYVGSKAIRMTEEERKASGWTIPSVPEGMEAFIYMELEGTDSAIQGILGGILNLTAEYGTDPYKAWAFTGYHETEKMHAYRHAVTETVNQFIARQHAGDERIHRVTANLFPDAGSFRSAMETCRAELEQSGLQAVICARIMEPEIEISMLPHDADEMQKSIQLVSGWTAGALRQEAK